MEIPIIGGVLLLGYFLKNDFKHCQQLNSDIVKIDIRTWLLNSYLCKNNNINYLNDTWFISGLSEFKDSDWKMEVDRFHLNDNSLETKLTNYAENI